jgi:hypothetical protein
MAKTPFELRHNLLQMATEHLMGEYHAKFETARVKADAAHHIMSLKTSQGMHFPIKDNAVYDTLDSVEYPSVERIIALAAQLKSFVDGEA